MLANVLAAVENVPQFGPLILRIPLPEIVAVRENALFGAGFFLVAAGTANAGVEFVFFDSVEQRGGLQRVTTCVEARFLFHAASVNRFLHRPHNQFGAQPFHQRVAVFKRFHEVVPRVDMDKRERQFCRIKRLVSQVSNHNRVLSAREQNRGPLKLSRHLAQNVNRFGLKFL